MTPLEVPSVPVSWGELLDKLTILAIKRERIAAAAPRANVAREYEALYRVGAPALAREGVPALFDALRAVNEALWTIEDDIRACEAVDDFGDGFIALARAVYRRNDERAAVKRRINVLLDSALTEEKSYWSPA